MPLDRYPQLRPDDGEVVAEELAVTDDVLVKAFGLGQGAELAPHEHPESTNVFHLVVGEVTVVQDGDEETLTAPAVVLNERGAEHGARNESGDVAVLTATMAPPP